MKNVFSVSIPDPLGKYFLHRTLKTQLKAKTFHAPIYIWGLGQCPTRTRLNGDFVITNIQSLKHHTTIFTTRVLGFSDGVKCRRNPKNRRPIIRRRFFNCRKYRRQKFVGTVSNDGFNKPSGDKCRRLFVTVGIEENSIFIHDNQLGCKMSPILIS